MRFLRIAACLAALLFSLTTLAAGAEVTYSGVPGKWKRASKEAKGKTSEAEAPEKESSKEKGTRTITVPKPQISVTPGTPSKK